MAGVGRHHGRSLAGAELPHAVQQDHQREIVRRAAQENEVQARRGLGLVFVVLAFGCTDPTTHVLPTAIDVELHEGALTALATVDDGTPFPIVIDTGSPLTAYDDGSGRVRARLGRLSVFGFDAAGAPVPRLQIDDTRLFTTPLGAIGTGAGFAIKGVLGGDNLQRFAVAIDYRTGASKPRPTVTLLSHLTPCDCELGNQCSAVVPFSLAGGGADRPIAVEGDLVTTAASRVLVTACLEPLLDPISRDIRCASSVACDFKSQAYLPHGLEVRVMVATGFPGFALSSGAFARLRGSAALAEAMSRPLVVQLPNGPLTVGTATLGGGELSALALVSKEGVLGPCHELARSRRHRRWPPGQGPLFPGADDESGCLVQPSLPGCSEPTDMGPSYVQRFCSGDVCGDLDTNTAAVVELARALPIWIVPDTAPLFAGINADVRPSNPTVEGIVGSEALTRLQLTLDYPRRRLIARCIEEGCLTYPRWIWRNADSDCAACEGRRHAAMRRAPPDAGVPDGVDLLPGNIACQPAEPLP